MSEKRFEWLWEVLRKRKRRQLDAIEQELVKRPGEKRAFAGDPNQAESMRLPLRQPK